MPLLYSYAPAIVNRYFEKYLTIRLLRLFLQLLPMIFPANSQFVCNFPIDIVCECATILAVERIEC